MAKAEVSGPVELVIQTRIVDHGAAAYANWQKEIGQTLLERPGFLGQQIFAPTPPSQVDWIVVQRFSSIETARSWLSSDTLISALADVESLFIGKDDVFLRTDVDAQALEVSALITCRVDSEHEAAFMDWEREMFRAEAKSPGFIGHRLDRPVPGIQDNWVIVLTFDGDKNLNAWMDSPERAKLLEIGAQFQRDVRVRKGNYGFGFWSRDNESTPTTPMVIFKSNLIVLLVLYPIVYLWGYLFGDPVLGHLGMPFWLALFIGNLFSTQVTGWWAVPWAFGWFKNWLKPDPTPKQEALGWAWVLSLYGLSMALYAYLLTLPKVSYF